MKKLMTRMVAIATLSSIAVAGMPVANALPETFSSPPKSIYRDESPNGGGSNAWRGCTRQLSHTHAYALGRGSSNSGYGVDTFSKKYEDRTEFFVRARLDGASERHATSLDFRIELENRDSRPLAYTVVSVPVGEGDYMPPTHEVPLPPTSGNIEPGKVSYIQAPLEDSGLPVYKYEPGAEDAQTMVWMYKITVPHDSDADLAFLPRIRGVLRMKTEPWPLENENCQPIAPIQLEDPTVTANGKEQKTGLFIPALGLNKDAYKRVETEVLYNGKPVEGARPVFRDNGELWLSIPEGAFGTDSEGETKDVTLRFYAKPRPETAHLGYEYAERMELRESTFSSGWGSPDNDRVTEKTPIYNRTIKVTIPTKQVENEAPGQTSSERLSSERSPLWWLLLIPLAGVIGFIVDQWVKSQQDQ